MLAIVLVCCARTQKANKGNRPWQWGAKVKLRWGHIAPHCSSSSSPSGLWEKCEGYRTRKPRNRTLQVLLASWVASDRPLVCLPRGPSKKQRLGQSHSGASSLSRGRGDFVHKPHLLSVVYKTEFRGISLALHAILILKLLLPGMPNALSILKKLGTLIVPGYMPVGGTAGPCGGWVFKWTSILFLLVAAPIYIPTNSTASPPSPAFTVCTFCDDILQNTFCFYFLRKGRDECGHPLWWPSQVHKSCDIYWPQPQVPCGR